MTHKREKRPMMIRTTVERVCDLCNRIQDEPQMDNWAGVSDFNRDSITVERLSGSVYPGDDMRERQSFDVCPECWTSKLLPWFAAQGAIPTEEDR